MKDLAAFSTREVKLQQQRKEKETIIPLEKDSGSKVGGKVIPGCFLKIEGRGTLVGAKDRRERNSYKNW